MSIKDELAAKVADANAFADKQTSWIAAHARSILFGAIGAVVLVGAILTLKLI